MSTTAKLPTHVDAPLNYSGGARGFGAHMVAIRNGRPLLEELSLDRQGFVLKHHETAVTDFYDASEVRSIFYLEIARLLEEVTGAAKVVPFEHEVRSTRVAESDAVRQTVKVVHDDYTTKSAPGRVRLYLPDDADRLLKYRYAVINAWKPISGPVQQAPLAVCDARSIADGDLTQTEEVVKHEVYLFRFSRSHRWFYFPLMGKHETLLIKCFDSIDDGRARVTAHTAFDDPTTPVSAPARESIEVRALVFFAPRA